MLNQRRSKSAAPTDFQLSQACIGFPLNASNDELPTRLYPYELQRLVTTSERGVEKNETVVSRSYTRFDVLRNNLRCLCFGFYRDLLAATAKIPVLKLPVTMVYHFVQVELCDVIPSILRKQTPL